MKIVITATIEDEDADPDDSTGVTGEFYDRLTEPFTGLGQFGFDDIEIRKADD